MCIRSVIAAVSLATSAVAVTAPSASADTQLNRGHLGQYCAARHGPRGVQTQADRLGYNRYGQPEALCRLVGVPYGYTLNNESVSQLCQFVGETGSHYRSGGSIVCRSASVSTAPVAAPPPIWRTPRNLGRRCFRTPTGFRCI